MSGWAGSFYWSSFSVLSIKRIGHDTDCLLTPCAGWTVLKWTYIIGWPIGQYQLLLLLLKLAIPRLSLCDRCKTTLPIVLTIELGYNHRLLRGEDKRSAWNLEFLCELICRCYVLMMQIGSSYTYLFFSKKKSRLCKVLCVDKPGWIIVPQNCGSLLSVKSWWSCIFF